MKQTMISFIFTAFILCITLSVTIASTTFDVAPVESSNVTHKLVNIITNEDLARWSTKKQNLTLENFQINYPLAEELNGYHRRVANAFVATVYQAYSHHYPLEISVEDIWVAIAQGISIHLNENAEKYRHLLVSHEGKKELKVVVNDLRLPESARPEEGDKTVPAIDWSQFVQRMTQLIKEDMKMDLKSIMTNPFSNTTTIEQAVFDCTLMDSVKNYYDYRAVLLCGIPRVTLRGSVADFQDVIDRLQRLRTMFSDFDWWIDSLIPHIEKMKASAAGHPDIDWWQKICHRVGGGSDITVLAGWLADFVPYVQNGKGHYVKARRDHHSFLQGMINGIDFEDFAESVTQTDFILDDNGREIKMKLIAGFLGISQNLETGALRPSLGWITAIPIDG